MAHPIRYAESSARKFGGKAEDYIALHTWLMSRKPTFRTLGIVHYVITPPGFFWLNARLASASPTANGRPPVRYLGEPHVREDLARIPTLQDWLVNLRPVPWMYGPRLDLPEEETPAQSSEPSHR